MSAHTPEPWRFVENQHCGDIESNHRRIANICASGHGATLEDEANGHLIAAAPKMFAALERAQQLFKEALPRFNWSASSLDSHAIRLLNEVPIEVSRALTKAKGEA